MSTASATSEPSFVIVGRMHASSAELARLLNPRPTAIEAGRFMLVGSLEREASTLENVCMIRLGLELIEVLPLGEIETAGLIEASVVSLAKGVRFAVGRLWVADDAPRFSAADLEDPVDESTVVEPVSGARFTGEILEISATALYQRVAGVLVTHLREHFVDDLDLEVDETYVISYDDEGGHAQLVDSAAAASRSSSVAPRPPAPRATRTLTLGAL